MTKLIKKTLMAGLFGLSLSAGVAMNATAATAGEEAGLIQCWTYDPDNCAQCCQDCFDGCLGSGYVCCVTEAS